MKIFLTILIGLISGLAIGIILVSIIGQLDLPLVHRSFGYKYLPYFSAIGGVVIGLIAMDQRKAK